jgi:hypothetical protein
MMIQALKGRHNFWGCFILTALRAVIFLWDWIQAFAGMAVVLRFLDNECGSILRITRRSDNNACSKSNLFFPPRLCASARDSVAFETLPCRITPSANPTYISFVPFVLFVVKNPLCPSCPLWLKKAGVRFTHPSLHPLR